MASGNPRATLEYAKERLVLVASGVALGAFPQGPQAVTISVGLGEESREVRVRKGRQLFH